MGEKTRVVCAREYMQRLAIESQIIALVTRIFSVMLAKRAYHIYVEDRVWHMRDVHVVYVNRPAATFCCAQTIHLKCVRTRC